MVFPLGFPSGSNSKESNYNSGGLSSIPGIGKDPLGEGIAAHSSILAWKIPMDKGAWQVAVHGVAKSQT